MSTVLLTGVLAVLGGLLGARTGRELATGGYRIEEDEATGSAGARWWPPVFLAAAWGALTWRLAGLADGAALPAYLLFAWLTVCLVWIDLDVHRLPNGLVLPAYPAVGALLAVASLADGGSRWRTALVSAVALLVVFVVLALLSRGGLGMGDVRLSGLMGLVLGWLGPDRVVAGVLLAFVIGGVAAVVLLVAGRAGRKTMIAFGPSMCLATLVVAGWGEGLLLRLAGW